MVYIAQFIYITQGQETVFDSFENIAIAKIPKYNGQLLFRVKPSENAYNETSIDKPFEIHFIKFCTKQDFESFMNDKERKYFLKDKEKSIKASFLVQGANL